MALSLQTVGSASEDLTFVQRIRGYLSIAAPSVYSESPSTPNHAVRVALAKAFATEPSLWASRFACLVAGDNAAIAGTTLAQITDAQIQASVGELVEYMGSLLG